MMMIRLGQHDQAEELLRGVLREAEVDADAERMSECYEGLALIAAHRGRDGQALELFQQALEVGDPPHPAQRPDLYIEMARLHPYAYTYFNGFAGGVQGALRMILMRDRSAEQREDAIPGRLRHIALVAMHRVHHQLERGIDQAARLLRVEVLDQLHRTLDVGE